MRAAATTCRLNRRQSRVSIWDTEPCLKNSESRVSFWDTNLVREPLKEPVKEEEDAAARDSDFDRVFAELLGALGLDPEGTLPGWWQGWPARTHVRRWIDELGLSGTRIIEVARDTRHEHPAPPDGPKAPDRAMQRAAQRDAQAATTGGSCRNPKRQRKRDTDPQPSDDELAAFYADLVNSEQFLPPSMISNAMCGLMLARGLVTPERLNQRVVA